MIRLYILKAVSVLKTTTPTVIILLSVDPKYLSPLTSHRITSLTSFFIGSPEQTQRNKHPLGKLGK
jgi:hypothetical protein